MRARAGRLLLAAGVTAAALALPVAPRAEVASCAPAPNYIILLGLTEGPDPIPQCDWGPVLDRPEGEVLNPSGQAQGDGRADVAVDSSTGYVPMAVWASAGAGGFEVAFVEWGPGGWPAAPEIVSAAAGDALDPRLFVDRDGAVVIVWWESLPTPRVLLAERPAGAHVFGSPEVVAEPGRRPSVLLDGERLLVAFERDAPGSGQEVVFALRKPTESFALQHVASVPSTDPLDVVVHARGERIWLEWKQGPSAFAYSELIDGQWVAPTVRPWFDRSWLGEEMMRRVIRKDLLSP